jgi:hypothetical protein
MKEFDREMEEYESNRAKYKCIFARESAERFQVIVKNKYLGTVTSLADGILLRDQHLSKV